MNAYQVLTRGWSVQDGITYNMEKHIVVSRSISEAESIFKNSYAKKEIHSIELLGTNVLVQEGE